MKQSFIILMLSFLFLSGCQSIQPQKEFSDISFDERMYISTNVLRSNVYTLDINNDGISEKAIHYINNDNIDTEHYSKRDHINIYQWYQNRWEIKYEYILPIINLDDVRIDWKSFEEPDSRIKDIIVKDIANDGSEALLVLIESNWLENWRFYSYEVIGKQGNKISTLDLPRGFDGETPGMRMEETGEFYGRLLGVDLIGGKIIEKWGGTCEGSTDPCYTFEFEISYDQTNDSWAISKAKNIKQIIAEWNRYVKEYGEQEWTGVLPF